MAGRDRVNRRRQEGIGENDTTGFPWRPGNTHTHTGGEESTFSMERNIERVWRAVLGKSEVKNENSGERVRVEVKQF